MLRRKKNSARIVIVVTLLLSVTNPRSSFLTATAVMTGGTQLVEGAHLTGGDTRFCRESSKSLGFYRGSENTIPCREKNMEDQFKCFIILHCSSLTQFFLNLRNFVANLALSRIRAFWGGTFGRNLAAGGTKTFKQTGVWPQNIRLFTTPLGDGWPHQSG